jgi:hypothetical protein
MQIISTFAPSQCTHQVNPRSSFDRFAGEAVSAGGRPFFGEFAGFASTA